MARFRRKPKKDPGAPVARATIKTTRTIAPQTLLTRSLWIVLVAAVGGILAAIALSALNRFVFGRAMTPGITPDAAGIDARLLLAQVIAAAFAALFAAAAGPKILMERAEIDVLGRQRAVFLAFLGGNGMIIVCTLVGATLGGILAPALLIIGLAAYGPLVMYLLGVPLNRPIDPPAAAAAITPVAAPPPAPDMPTPRAPRPPASITTPTTSTSAPMSSGLPDTNPVAAAHWLIDFAVWAATLRPLLERAQVSGDWNPIASERQRAHDFATNLPAAGDEAIANAMRHLQGALSTMSGAADPTSLAATVTAVDALRAQIVDEPRVRAFVAAHRG